MLDLQFEIFCFYSSVLCMFFVLFLIILPEYIENKVVFDSKKIKTPFT